MYRENAAAFAVAVLMLTSSASAQTPPQPAPPPGQPQQIDPPAESTPPADTQGQLVDPNKPLSEELKEKQGVLEPPRDLDSKIERPAPVPNPNTTPVIPPPGSPGGNPNIEPR